MTYPGVSKKRPSRAVGRKRATHRLGDVVNDDGAVRITVVHGCQGLVALLAGCIPDFKLHRGVLVEGDGLCEEGGTDGGFPVRVELVFDEAQNDGALGRWVSMRCAPRAGRQAGMIIPFQLPTRLQMIVLASFAPPRGPGRVGQTQQNQLELREAGVHAARACRTAPGGHGECSGRMGSAVGLQRSFESGRSGDASSVARGSEPGAITGA